MSNMMDENLVGYVLKCLDAEEQREVERWVRTQPEAAHRLELVRRALLPLSADRAELPSPPGLWVRTLARVAEYRCRTLPLFPKAPPVRPSTSPRVWWRRADVLVAACLLIVLLPLVLPGLSYLRYQRNIVACQNNLRVFALGLMSYADRHQGALPKVEDVPPRNYAGIFVPVLRQEGLLSPEVSVRCPASGLPSPSPITLAMLEGEYRAGDRCQFEEHVRQLAGCYAYVLGYRGTDGRLCGLWRNDPQREQPTERLPILGDRPPFEQQDRGPLAGNSRNHEGKGQNVLHLDGHVAFYPRRDVGVGGKDIYLNVLHRPEAGVNPLDAVLGASAFKPALQIEGP